MGCVHAVVAGGSIAGLATAQALAETFDTVTLVERDGYPPRGDGFRRRVPQARHLHALWEGGQRALEQLFPRADPGSAPGRRARSARQQTCPG